MVTEKNNAWQLYTVLYDLDINSFKNLLRKGEFISVAN